MTLPWGSELLRYVDSFIISSNWSSFVVADPICIPPEEGEGGEGMMIFSRDTPFGMFAYFWIYIGGPLTVVAHTILVFRLIGKSNRSVGVHFNEH